jgi:hypothetical protein
MAGIQVRYSTRVTRVHLTMALLVAMLAGLSNTDLTVYHVNPLREGVIPVNMNTADLRGDIFFDLRSKVLPIECASNPQSKDCTNEEVVDNDLVIMATTKVSSITAGRFRQLLPELGFVNCASDLRGQVSSIAYPNRVSSIAILTCVSDRSTLVDREMKSRAGDTCLL